MHDFLTKLAGQKSASNTSEHLKLLGKQAASRYVSKQASSLDDALSEILQGEDLSREQINRVTESANQETWKALFVEGGDRHTEFNPAHPESVIGSMSVKPQDVPVYQDRELDFTGDVPQQQLPDVDFKQLFGIKDENIADYPALNPSASEENQVHKTASAVDHGRRYIEITASRLADAGEEFYNLVKQAHLTDGYGILQISKVAGAMVEDPHFAQSVMQSITARLEAEGVRFNTKDELEKVAHPLVINTKHPLAQAVANLEAAAIAHYQSQEDIQKLASAHQGAVQALRKKARR